MVQHSLTRVADGGKRGTVRRPTSLLRRLSLRWSDCPEYIEKRTYVVCINASLLARIHTVTQIYAVLKMSQI